MAIFPGFVGPSYQGQSLNASAEELINLYVETIESPNANPQQVLYGTPGLSVVCTCPNGPVRGQFYMDNRAFAVAGGGLYETTTGQAVLLGIVSNDGLPASLASNGAGGHQLAVVSGGMGYLYDLNTGVFSQIMATGFPSGTALQVAYFDGYFVALAPSFFAISGLEDGATWNGTDHAQRSISPDQMVAMLANHPALWLFGSQRTEAWYNSGAANFPFAPIPSVALDQGLAAAWSPAIVDNSVGWLARNRDGDRTVMLANQYSPQRISTYAVETALAGYPDVSDFIGFAYQEAGHTFYVLTSAANAITWVYDVGEKSWHKRGWWNQTTGQLEAIRARNHVAAFGAHWVGDRGNGNIYKQAIGIYSDNGTPIRSLRRMPHLVNEQKRVAYGRLQIDVEPGVGLALGQGADPQLMLRWSDDGGHTWSNEHWTSIGAIGAYGTRAIWNRLGAGRNRVFEVVQTDPVKRAWLAAYLEAERLAA